MVSAHFDGDGLRYQAHAALCAVVVALGMSLATGTAWADPSDDTTASTESPASDPDTPATVDPQPGNDDTPVPPAERSDPPPPATGGGSSESEVKLGGDGAPEVIIRSSGGHDADESPTASQQPAEQPSAVEAAPATPSPEPASTPTAEVPAAAEVPPAVTIVATDPDLPVHVIDQRPARLRVQPMDDEYDAVTVGAQPMSGSVTAGAGTATPANAEARSGSVTTTASPSNPAGGLFTAPDGFLGAASALFSGVLHVLFEPMPGTAPPDSPIVWAVLGLVRRQFNPAPSANPATDPRQTSREFDGGAEAFTIVADRYAYVLNRGANAMTAVDLDTDEVVDFPVAPGQLVRSPVVSPDGTRVFVTRPENGGVYAIDVVMGTTVDIEDATAGSDPIIAGRYVGPTDYFVPDGGLAFSPDGALLYISRQHAQVVSGLFLPADGDVVVVGNDPSDPATYLQVIGGPVSVEV